MKRALISDIHGNLEALNAVLDDIRQQGISEIYCLGDVIGYGPNPVECLDIVRRKCAMCLLGNHDQAALFDPEGFNPVAFRAILWTRDQIDNSSGGAVAVNERWDFLGELPRTHVEPNRLFVHGSPRDPTNEYVFPEDIYNQRKMERIFGLVESYCFQGHTHIPGVFQEEYSFASPDEIGSEVKLGDRKVLVNVGSVGQPRDGDSRAAYIVLDQTAKTVQFRRVLYDIEKTISKIYAIPELDNFLGDRLRDGR